MEVKNILREAERGNTPVGGGVEVPGIEVHSVLPKAGQVTQQQYSLEGVTSDTADLINGLADKLRRVTHPAKPSSELQSGKSDKPLVGMASDLEKILNQALANRDALRSLLERIDL